MRTVIALILDREARARIVAGTRNVGVAEFVETAAEARRACVEHSPAVVIVEPRDREGTSTAALIADLRRDFQTVPVLAYCAAGPAVAADILAVARAGVSGLLLRGHDDVGLALRSALAAAADDCAARHILRELEDAIPRSALPLFEHCVLNGRRPLKVAAVARDLGVDRKTLVNRLHALGLPSPRIMIGWLRILVVAHELEKPGYPVERIAVDFDFPSSTALRNMLKRYTGLRPAELRQNGGLRCALHLFRQVLAREKQAAARQSTSEPDGLDPAPPVAQRHG